ncbi:hypothetical protein AB0F13_01250 [Streptomyces sp. NPDC026206]|uniref:hypothetical protein n=1 Tax=Streptomyces sp. NPDC026206 TaxID=3157089 RepID=UPI0033C88969
MTSPTRHARPASPPSLSRALKCLGLTVSAGAALVGAGGAAPAHADTSGPSATVGPIDVGAALQDGAGTALVQSVTAAGLGLREFPVNPLARGGFNPLDNSVGTQISDFQPVSTAMITGPLAKSSKVEQLPLVGGLVNTLLVH